MLKVASFNCKSIKTSALFINDLLKKNSIILLQEHWLFQFQLHLLKEIGENIYYEAKGVDKENPIQPTQVPRGYGGVAVFLRKNIEHMVRELPDGNECMQCIEVIEKQ